MTSQIELTRTRILNAMAELLRREGADRLTNDRIARQAGCAKGLVNYHYQTKDLLTADFVRYLGDRRLRRWRRSVRTDPADAISATWRAVRADASQRVIMYSAKVVGSGSAVDTAVSKNREDMAELLGGFAERVMETLGLRSTIPMRQIGWMLSAVVDGAVLQLADSPDRQIVEDGYSAAWLGVLALGKPR